MVLDEGGQFLDLPGLPGGDGEVIVEVELEEAREGSLEGVGDPRVEDEVEQLSFGDGWPLLQQQ